MGFITGSYVTILRKQGVETRETMVSRTMITLLLV